MNYQTISSRFILPTKSACGRSSKFANSNNSFELKIWHKYWISAGVQQRIDRDFDPDDGDNTCR